MTNLSAAILDPLMRTDPASPRITYYDDAVGERIELSAATLANWAAKTANLLRDEFGAGPTSRVAVLLPAHWQTAAVLLGAWWIGSEVTLADEGSAGTGSADVALCTAARLADGDAAVKGGGELLVLSLDPFGRPVPDLPAGVSDYASAVRVHGDQIDAERHPGPALTGRSPDQVLAACQTSAATAGLTATDRVWSARSWDTADELVDNMLAVLAIGASLVQVSNPDPAAQQRRRAAEKVTRVFD